MKKLFIIVFMLIALTAVSIAQDRTGAIGGNFTRFNMSCSAADAITTSDSLVILVTNPQKYLQHQQLTTTLTTVSGAPSITITLRGRVTANDTWHPIGSAGTWASSSDNPITITSTTPHNYNWLRLSYVANGTAQSAKLATCEFKTSNVLEVPTSAGTLTIARQDAGTVTVQVADDNANAAAVYRAGGTSALTLGAAAGTTAITSSDWAIGATGIATGLGAITSDGLITGTLGTTITGAVVNLNASSNFAVNVATGSSSGSITIGGNSNTVAVNSSDWDINATGDMTGVGAITSDGLITAGGGYTFTNVSPVIWAKGGSTVLATSGTDKACSNGARWWVELDIPYNVTLTGVAYLIGSVGATDSVVVQLCNSAGVQVATSKTTGATHGAIVGTAAQFQSCPFAVGATPTPYAAVAGKYYAVVQFNGTTAKFRTYPIPGSKFITGTAAGTWNTKEDITPGTTFTADYGPIIMTY
jgi:hypothetical protein